MQTLRPVGFPTVHSSFQRHRSSIDHPRFPLNLTLSKPSASPIWASLPTPPMSGSPPPEPPRDLSQLAGRRRKRSDTPPSTTGQYTTLPPLVEHPPYTYGVPQTRERRDEPSMQVATQPIPFLPPLSYGVRPGVSLSQYSQSSITLAQSQASPRSTRKGKGHVASACNHCKNKHLRCDSSRPCRRCVQGGKEDTCVDVEHKKRGRPPLKPEDSASVGRARGSAMALPGGGYSDPTTSTYGSESRSYGTSGFPPILPSAPSSSIFAPGHARSSSTSTYSAFQSPYAHSSVAQSPMTSTTSGYTYSTRPQSTSSAMSGQIPSPYSMHGPSILPDQYTRQLPMYSGGYGPPLFPPDTITSNQPYYTGQIFAREQQQQLLQSGSQGERHISGRGSELNLAPIQTFPRSGSLGAPFSPSGRSTYPEPQNIPTSAPIQERRDRGQERERNPKRPKMDIEDLLRPKNE